MAAVREAFLAKDALAAVVGLLAEPLSRHPKMTERDGTLVELVITFLSNMLAIGGGPAHVKQRQSFIEKLFADDVGDLLRLLASHARHRPFRTHAARLVEAFYSLFKHYNPAVLVGVDDQLKKEQKEADLRAKTAARAAQQQQQQQQQLGRHGSNGTATTAHLPHLPNGLGGTRAVLPPRHISGAALQKMAVKSAAGPSMAAAAPSRHAHSGAVYVRRHLDHSGQVLLRNNPNRTELPKLSAATSDPKKLKAYQGDGPSGHGPSSSGSIANPGSLSSDSGRSSLSSAKHNIKIRDHLELFLTEAYAPLMKAVFGELRSGLLLSRLDKEDFENFIKFSAFCLQYVRLREERNLQGKMKGPTTGTGKVGEHQEDEESKKAEEASPFAAVGATLDWDTFHWVRVLMLQLADMDEGARTSRQTDHTGKNWSLQHATVPLLKEMLLTLDLARVAGNTEDKGAADRLQRRLLHDDSKESGLLAVVSKLIKGYNFRFQPRSSAVDLVETLHVVLASLDRLIASEPGGFKVRQKAVKQRKAKKKKERKTSKGSGEEQEIQQQLDGQEGAAVATGDGATTTKSPQQQQQQGDVDGAPVDKAGGADGSDDEGMHWMMGMSAGVTTNGGREEVQQKQQDAALPSTENPSRQQQQQQEEEEKEEEEESDTDEDEEGAAATPRFVEKDFQAAQRIRQECAHSTMVHFYIWLLQDYRTNREFTNHSLVSFLERISSSSNTTTNPGGLGLESMLWQMSALRVFNEVLNDTGVVKKGQHPELLNLAKRVVRSLMTRLCPDLTADKNALALAKAEEEEAKLMLDLAEEEEERRRRDGNGGNEQQQQRQQGVEGEEVPAGPPINDATATATYDDDARLDAMSALTAAREARRKAELTIKMKEGCASMAFIELLFWKGPNVAEAVGDEYSWRKIVDPPPEEEKGGGGRRRRRSMGDGDDNDEYDGDYDGKGGRGQLGFASFRKKKPGCFTEEQAQKLTEAFERCNGRKDCLSELLFEFGGAFKKVHISKQLKTMGLAKGKLTQKQKNRLAELYQEHHLVNRRGWPELIAVDLDAGFTKNQIRRAAKEMGLLPAVAPRNTAAVGGGKKRSKVAGSAVNKEGCGSDGSSLSSSSDSGSSSSDDSSSSDSGSSGSSDSDSDDDGDGKKKEQDDVQQVAGCSPTAAAGLTAAMPSSPLSGKRKTAEAEEMEETEAKNKKKPKHAEEDDLASKQAKRVAALDFLRQKRLGAAMQTGDYANEAVAEEERAPQQVAAVQQQQQQQQERMEADISNNNNSVPSPAKVMNKAKERNSPDENNADNNGEKNKKKGKLVKAGRRLKKANDDDDGEVAAMLPPPPPGLFDDLDDF
jgi:hypothetical protein